MNLFTRNNLHYHPKKYLVFFLKKTCRYVSTRNQRFEPGFSPPECLHLFFLMQLLLATYTIDEEKQILHNIFRSLVRPRLKRDGTRAETRFRLWAKRTSLFKSTGWRQFSRLLAAEVCVSAVVMLDTPCSEVV